WFNSLGQAVTDKERIKSFGDAWHGVINVFKKGWEVVKPALEWIGKAMAGAWEGIKGFFKSLDFNVLFGFLNVAAIGGFAIVVKKAFDKFLDGIKGVLGTDGE